MVEDDPFADGESQPGSLADRFGGEEGMEDPVGLLPGESGPLSMMWRTTFRSSGISRRMITCR